MKLISALKKYIEEDYAYLLTLLVLGALAALLLVLCKSW